MTERERLVMLIDNGPAHFCNGCNESPEERAESVEKLADCLIASDVVEVVRCKDCRLRETSDCPMAYCYEGTMYDEAEDNDYCGYGERREK